MKELEIPYKLVYNTLQFGWSSAKKLSLKTQILKGLIFQTSERTTNIQPEGKEEKEIWFDNFFFHCQLIINNYVQLLSKIFKTKFNFIGVVQIQKKKKCNKKKLNAS